MKTSLATRLFGLIASLAVTFAIVDLIAGYALPEAAPIHLATAAKK
jgi:hypothetical protein